MINNHRVLVGHRIDANRRWDIEAPLYPDVIDDGNSINRRVINDIELPDEIKSTIAILCVRPDSNLGERRTKDQYDPQCYDDVFVINNVSDDAIWDCIRQAQSHDYYYKRDREHR